MTATRVARAVRAAVVALVVLSTGVAVAEVRLPQPAGHEPITIRADATSQWAEGAYVVRRLQGNVSIEQGGVVARADDAVVWVEPARRLGEATKVIAYLEASGDRRIALEWRPADQSATSDPAARQQAPNWFGRFASTAPISWRTPEPTPAPTEMPAIHARGVARFQGAPLRLPPTDTINTGVVQAAVGADGVPAGGESPIQQAQFQAAPFQQAQFQQTFPQFAPPGFALPSSPLVPTPSPATPSANGFRSIQINPRSTVGGRAEYRPQQGVGVITGGVNIIVEGLRVDGLPSGLSLGDGGLGAGGPGSGVLDKIDLVTDRAVVWTAPGSGVSGSFQQSTDAPLEIYMEGNIVFRQGDRTVYAERMYYDVRSRVGVVLGAELLTPLNEIDGVEYEGIVRLKAGVIRQLDDSRFVATDALVTTSRLEEPTYSLNSDTITFEDIRRPVVDPATGIVRYEHERLAKSRSNTVELGGVPLLYWPTITTDLEEPTFYINDLQVGNDAIFGTQVLLDLDVYEVFGLDEIDGTDWDLSLDVLSDRGFGYGTEFAYDRDRFAGLNGPAVGRLDAWAIDDGGVDNLGFGRRNITPEEAYRGRVFWNHRQRLADGLLEGWVAQAEVGWISDRTFLEQYYESEWDENKDQTTGVRLKRLDDIQSLSIEANARLNHFFSQTQWLPRLDHYLIGKDLLGETLTWHAHSQAGYANLKVASTPTEPTLAGNFNLYPWETDGGGVARVDGEGERIVTRQEIDLPLDFAPFKVVPYVLGEFAHWGADINGNDLQRAYLQTGVRASIPFWAVNPAVQDPLFNLNGLAHKVVFDAELSYADANRNFDDVPLYDEIDDDAIEEIRRSLFLPAFPVQFDPRFYAIRSGLQGYVTSPTTELVEDQTALRLGMRHRLQTKRGAPGRQRIVDWVTLDANLSLFPDAGRDNFGEEVGLIDYDLRWHVGDRFAIVSDGFADVFDDGLRTISGGLRVNRPLRGNAYLGYRTIRGPFSADLITATVNYRLGPKWIASGSTVIDLSEAGNIGQSVAFTRVGESLNFTLGANVDESKDNVGFSFLVEPRFLPSLGLTRRTGIVVPPAGVNYLE